MLCPLSLCPSHPLRLGLPTSSSQCITGGIVGVGLMEGVRSGVNWNMFAQQFASWVSTLFVVGLATAALFAQVRSGPAGWQRILVCRPDLSCSMTLSKLQGTCIAHLQYPLGSGGMSCTLNVVFSHKAVVHASTYATCASLGLDSLLQPHLGSTCCCFLMCVMCADRLSRRASTLPVLLMVARCCSTRTAWQQPTARCSKTSTAHCWACSRHPPQVRLPSMCHALHHNLGDCAGQRGRCWLHAALGAV